MRRSQERVQVFRGEITAFLALLFVLTLSLVGALVESASIQISKNRKRSDAILALESVVAEYDREMLERYDLFVRTECEEEVINYRLHYYGATNMTHTIEKRELLTDDSGRPFYEQVVRYIKNWIGIDNVETESEYDFSSESLMKEDEELVTEELQKLLEEEGEEISAEGNPIFTVQNLKNTSLLTLVAPEPENLSDRNLSIEKLPSHRMLQTGDYWEKTQDGIADKGCFVAYINEHFTNMTNGNDKNTILYEQEYLLGGFGSDKENLEEVCRRILNVRMAANYVYLLTDAAKQAEAETMALALCTAMASPGITVLVKQAILLAFAYGEAIVDVRVLLKGEKVPSVKTAETWQLQLSNLVALGTEDEVTSELRSSNGLGYEDYLKGLLLLESRENLSMRCLDLIESNLQIKSDECVTKMEIVSEVKLRRGVEDSFSTMYEYQ